MLQQDALDKLRKTGLVTSLEEDPPVTEWTSTGCPSVDLALGGGIPVGRITEIYGMEGAGKTALALSISKEMQAKGEDVIWVDAECALVPEHLVGLDPAHFYRVESDYGEQSMDVVHDAVVGGVGLVVVDSVAALVPKQEVDGTMENNQVGLQARMMGKALRKLAGLVGKSRSTLILVNQIRYKTGVVYGNPEVTPGGKAIPFWTSLILRVKKDEDIKQGAEKIGMRCSVTSVKNRLAPPGKEGFFDILFTEGGIDKEAGLLDAAEAKGVVTKRGPYIYHTSTGEQMCQGKENFKKLLRESPELFAELYKEIFSAWLP